MPFLKNHGYSKKRDDDQSLCAEHTREIGGSAGTHGSVSGAA